MNTFFQKMKKLSGMAAASILVLVLTGNNAFAGSIILTGHDTDDHLASGFMNWAITALLNAGDGTNRPIASNVTPRIGFLGNTSASLGTYLGFYDNFAFYDLDNANWTNAFTENNDVLVIGSGFDFVNSTGSTTINAASASFTSYFNGGGNLFVNTHQGLGASFYNFLPPVGNVNASNLTTCSSENGSGTCMTPSAAGAASGLLIGDIVQASITHNQFTPVSAFTSLETYVPTGNSITIGLFEGQIGGGGFTPPGQIPEPGTIAIFVLGLLGLGARKFKKL